VQVSDRRKEVTDFPEGLVSVNLFEVGLRQTHGVLSIFLQWSGQDFFALSKNPFFLYDGLLLIILGEMKFIFPFNLAISLTQTDMDNDVRISACRQASQPRNATAFENGILKPATNRYYMRKKAKDVQKVRFPRSIGTDQKSPPLQWHINTEEIPPIPQVYLRETECAAPLFSHGLSSSNSARAGAPLLNVAGQDAQPHRSRPETLFLLVPRGVPPLLPEERSESHRDDLFIPKI
jgi:hypothetical protein